MESGGLSIEVPTEAAAERAGESVDFGHLKTGVSNIEGIAVEVVLDEARPAALHCSERAGETSAAAVHVPEELEQIETADIFVAKAEQSLEHNPDAEMKPIDTMLLEGTQSVRSADDPLSPPPETEAAGVVHHTPVGMGELNILDPRSEEECAHVVEESTVLRESDVVEVGVAPADVAPVRDDLTEEAGAMAEATDCGRSETALDALRESDMSLASPDDAGTIIVVQQSDVAAESSAEVLPLIEVTLDSSLSVESLGDLAAEEGPGIEIEALPLPNPLAESSGDAGEETQEQSGATFEVDGCGLFTTAAMIEEVEVPLITSAGGMFANDQITVPDENIHAEDSEVISAQQGGAFIGSEEEMAARRQDVPVAIALDELEEGLPIAASEHKTPATAEVAGPICDQEPCEALAPRSGPTSIPSEPMAQEVACVDAVEDVKVRESTEEAVNTREEADAAEVIPGFEVSLPEEVLVETMAEAEMNTESGVDDDGITQNQAERPQEPAEIAGEPALQSTVVIAAAAEEPLAAAAGEIGVDMEDDSILPVGTTGLESSDEKNESENAEKADSAAVELEGATNVAPQVGDDDAPHVTTPFPTEDDAHDRITKVFSQVANVATTSPAGQDLKVSVIVDEDDAQNGVDAIHAYDCLTETTTPVVQEADTDVATVTEVVERNLEPFVGSVESVVDAESKHSIVPAIVSPNLDNGEEISLKGGENVLSDESVIEQVAMTLPACETLFEMDTNGAVLGEYLDLQQMGSSPKTLDVVDTEAVSLPVEDSILDPSVKLDVPLNCESSVCHEQSTEPNVSSSDPPRQPLTSSEVPKDSAPPVNQDDDMADCKGASSLVSNHGDMAEVNRRKGVENHVDDSLPKETVDLTVPDEVENVESETVTPVEVEKNDKKRGRPEEDAAGEDVEKIWKTPKSAVNNESEVVDNGKMEKKRSRDESEAGTKAAKTPKKEVQLPESNNNGVGMECNGNESQCYKKRKIAVLVAYCGAGSQGMEWNSGAKTIEGELENALFRAGAIAESSLGKPKELDWMRAARTDEGASASGQVVSGRFLVDSPGFVERVNSYLPNQIRLLGYKTVLDSFDAQSMCDQRKYEYVLPVYVFNPQLPLVAKSTSAGGQNGIEEVKNGSTRGEKTSSVDKTITVEDKRLFPPVEDLTPDVLASADQKHNTINDIVQKNDETGSIEKVVTQEALGCEILVESQAKEPNDKLADDMKIAPPQEENVAEQEQLASMEEVNTRKTYEFGEADMNRLNRILEQYLGTHNFHNFTSSVKADDPSVLLSVTSFEAQKTFDIDGMEFVSCTVVGQSFMFHQICKMIGLAVAIMRGDASESLLEAALRRDTKVDVPMAPELGLLLEECYYSSYNRSFGSSHEEVSLIDFVKEVDDFKKGVLYPHIASTEAKESTFASWLLSINPQVSLQQVKVG